MQTINKNSLKQINQIQTYITNDIFKKNSENLQQYKIQLFQFLNKNKQLQQQICNNWFIF